MRKKQKLQKSNQKQLPQAGEQMKVQQFVQLMFAFYTAPVR
jgi:hypothetical protein